jgi:hypothetical protein
VAQLHGPFHSFMFTSLIRDIQTTTFVDVIAWRDRLGRQAVCSLSSTSVGSIPSSPLNFFRIVSNKHDCSHGIHCIVLMTVQLGNIVDDRTSPHFKWPRPNLFGITSHIIPRHFLDYVVPSSSTLM